MESQLNVDTLNNQEAGHFSKVHSISGTRKSKDALKKVLFNDRSLSLLLYDIMVFLGFVYKLGFLLLLEI